MNLWIIKIITIFFDCCRWIIWKTKYFNSKRDNIISWIQDIIMIKNYPISIFTVFYKKGIISPCSNKYSFLRFCRKIFWLILHPGYIIAKIFKCPMECKMDPTMRMFSIGISPYNYCIIFKISHSNYFLANI